MESRPKQILVLHGPNLNLLGIREPDTYGSTSLAEINEGLIARGKEVGLEVSCIQSNHEGVLLDRIHQAMADGVEFILFNPAGYTHTSVALRDAMLAVKIPFVEVHLSDPASRESFRRHSYLSDIAESVLSGLGPYVYTSALDFAASWLADH